MVLPLDGAGTRRLGRRLLRAGTVASGAVSVGVALLGALYAGHRILLVVLVFGAVGWVVARSLRRLADSVSGRADGTGLSLAGGLPTATGAALLVPFCTGIRELGAVGAYLALLLAGLLSVHGTVWIHRLDAGARPAGTGGSAPPDGDPGRCPPQELLRRLTLEDLAAEWHATAGEVDRAPGVDRHAVVRWRDAVLEEIRRRDPVGFDEWLLSGAAGTPGGHVRAVPEEPAPRPEDPTR